MLRFVDMRRAEAAGYRFAWWDTVRDMFVELAGDQAWDTWADFEQSQRDALELATTYADAWKDTKRFRGLTPKWAFEDAALVG